MMKPALIGKKGRQWCANRLAALEAIADGVHAEPQPLSPPAPKAPRPPLGLQRYATDYGRGPCMWFITRGYLHVPLRDALRHPVTAWRALFQKD